MPRVDPLTATLAGRLATVKDVKGGEMSETAALREKAVEVDSDNLDLHGTFVLLDDAEREVARAGALAASAAEREIARLTEQIARVSDVARDEARRGDAHRCRKKYHEHLSLNRKGTRPR